MTQFSFFFLFLFFTVLDHKQRPVAELMCCTALCWQMDWLLTNSSTQCLHRHGHLHSTDWLPLCADLLALPWMTTMLHPSLSLHHKRVLCGAGCCCLLVSLCHHYSVTDRITRMGEGVWGGLSEGGDCNRSWSRSHLGPQKSDHVSIHLHVGIPNGSQALGNPEGKDTDQCPD